MNGATAQALAGTEDAYGPFWSPDSRSIGFFARDKLVRIDASGGAPLRLADALHGRGGAWGLNGTILYAPNTRGPLYRVEASGGTPQPATKLDAAAKQIVHRWPQFLPDGEHFLYFAPSPLGGSRHLQVP